VHRPAALADHRVGGYRAPTYPAMGVGDQLQAERVHPGKWLTVLPSVSTTAEPSGEPWQDDDAVIPGGSGRHFGVI
jgi:hypothetical protein